METFETSTKYIEPFFGFTIFKKKKKKKKKKKFVIKS